MKAASTVFNVISIFFYIIAWIISGRQPGAGLVWIFFLPAIAVCLIVLDRGQDSCRSHPTETR